MKKIAIVPARGLGDGLIYAALAYNFVRSKIKTTIFSTPLYPLREWFPEHDILPFPEEGKKKDILSHYETIIASDHSIIREEELYGNFLHIIKESSLDKKKSFVANLGELAFSRFRLKYCLEQNGIKPPAGLTHRKHQKRVVIHPMSSDLKKNWTPEKYHKIFQILKRQGYKPFFCVSPEERKEWPNSPLFPQITDAAAFIYESGYMLGNDSGIGHLASSLNIPTLTLFSRRSYSMLWRPGFCLGLVVSPFPFLIGARLKEKYWKKTLSCKRVFAAFEKLVKLDREKNASASFSQLA